MLYVIKHIGHITLTLTLFLGIIQCSGLNAFLVKVPSQSPSQGWMALWDGLEQGNNVKTQFLDFLI